MSTVERPVPQSSEAHIPHTHKIFADCHPKLSPHSTTEESDELMVLTDVDDASDSDYDSFHSLSPVYRMCPLQNTTTPIDLEDHHDNICIEFSGDEGTDIEQEQEEEEEEPFDTHQHSDLLYEAPHSDSDSNPIDYYHSDSANNEEVSEDIIIQRFSRNEHVAFDKVIQSASSRTIIDSRGRSRGVCEWEIEIVNVDVDLTEIGVVGSCDAKSLMSIDEGGIRHSALCGPRSVIGSELSSNTMYHATFDADNARLCVRDLAQCRRIGWCTGDTVKVCLDLDDWRISYFVNGQRMGKAVQLQRERTYYPVISFAGQCQFYLH